MPSTTGFQPIAGAALLSSAGHLTRRPVAGSGVSATASITVRVPLAIRRRPGRKTVVTPVGSSETVQTRADPALLKALARAFRWKRMLDEGRYASISEMAAAERIERGYLGRVLQLTLLAPAVVEAIMDGRQGADVSLPALMGGVRALWEEQRRSG